MKYKVVTIKEDNTILAGLSDYKWAKLVSCTPMYINFLRNGKTIATQSFYNKLVQARLLLQEKNTGKEKY